MYCKDIRHDVRAYRKYCYNMLYRTQFLHNQKAKVFIRSSITDVDLVQNRNTSRYAEAVNEAESIRSAIRDYLANR